MQKTRKKMIMIVVIFIAVIFTMFGSYSYALTEVSKVDESVLFVVQSGESKITIAEHLKSAGLIRSKYALLFYLFFNTDLNLQAGTYELNRNMDATSIIDVIHEGKVKMDTITFTFVEGKNMNDFIKMISNAFPYTEKEVKAVLNNQEFIKSLVEKYDFLTDEVLDGNIYYALEGYLFPDTYEFLENVSIEEIVMKMLDNTQVKLSSLDSYAEYSIHELLTMASIVELEAVSENDRASVAQVIFKRLSMGKGLGMDVTTYYAVQKALGETLTMNDLKTVNPYNTSESNSSMAGKLPVGPICNPSLMSIKAVLNPSDTEYIWFYANIRTHEVFFAETYEEFIAIQREVG